MGGRGFNRDPARLNGLRGALGHPRSPLSPPLSSQAWSRVCWTCVWGKPGEGVGSDTPPPLSIPTTVWRGSGMGLAPWGTSADSLSPRQGEAESHHPPSPGLWQAGLPSHHPR